MSTQLTMAELEQAEERELGTSSWVPLEQRHIDLFAEATGDHQWIHVDPAAAAQGPFGQTVAHGYLTLSLLPALLSEVFSVLHAKLLGSDRRPAGVLFRIGVEMEIEGGEKPALVGEVLYLAYA